MLKVTLVKSIIGNTPSNRATVAALGLRKIGQSNTFDDSPSIRGMIHKVKHLLKVEETDKGEVVRRRRDGKAAAAVRDAKLISKVTGTKTAPKTAPKAEKPKATKAEAKPAKAATEKKAPAKKPTAAKKTTKKDGTE